MTITAIYRQFRGLLRFKKNIPDFKMNEMAWNMGHADAQCGKHRNPYLENTDAYYSYLSGQEFDDWCSHNAW